MSSIAHLFALLMQLEGPLDLTAYIKITEDGDKFVSFGSFGEVCRAALEIGSDKRLVGFFKWHFSKITNTVCLIRSQWNVFAYTSRHQLRLSGWKLWVGYNLTLLVHKAYGQHGLPEIAQGNKDLAEAPPQEHCTIVGRNIPWQVDWNGIPLDTLRRPPHLCPGWFVPVLPATVGTCYSSVAMFVSGVLIWHLIQTCDTAEGLAYCQYISSSSIKTTWV